MTENEKLQNMVGAFRMSELQSLMVFAGKSKAGRKTDLQVFFRNLYDGLLNLRDLLLFIISFYFSDIFRRGL